MTAKIALKTYQNKGPTLNVKVKQIISKLGYFDDSTKTLNQSNQNNQIFEMTINWLSDQMNSTFKQSQLNNSP